MKPTAQTKTRSTFLDRLAQIDAILKTDRQPIDATALNEAVERARQSWAKWSPARRPQARADLEATLQAELKHSRADFIRLADKHDALGLFDLYDRSNDPAEFYRLPRERAAAAAQNALTHAAIQTRLVAEQIGRLRKQREASIDANQTSEYRADWAHRLTGTRADLEALIKRRRREWQRALQLIAEYQTATST